MSGEIALGNGQAAVPQLLESLEGGISYGSGSVPSFAHSPLRHDDAEMNFR
jgi:hypothetical protein